MPAAPRASRGRRRTALPRAGASFLFVSSLAPLSATTATLAFPSAANAGGPLGSQGAPIQTSAYTLDLFQGPVLASSRITGMGGAYAALAEGPEGISTNAASASQRSPYSTTNTDYDVTAGVTFPSAVVRTDFDNNGRVGFGYRDFVWATLGGYLQHGPWGIGASLSAQNYALGTPSSSQPVPADVSALTVRVFKFDLVVSHAMMEDQLHVGGGLRGASFTAVTSGEKLLMGTYGVGAQGALLWRPKRLPLRLGATIRSPVIGSIDAAPNVTTDPATGDRLVGRFYLPSGVSLPWEAEWGVAVQIGERPLNIPWTDEDTLTGPEVEAERRMEAGDRTTPPHLEPRYKAARRMIRRNMRGLPREKLLVSLSTLVTGITSRAVGVESMLTQVVDRSGEKTSLTMRLGAEAEIFPNRLQLRVGSYMEPTRFRESNPRLHGTSGFELRVLDWSFFGLFPEDNVFRISGAVDVSRQYFGWSLGIGSWY